MKAKGGWNMASVREITLQPRGDSRGKLIPLEAGGR